MYRHVRSQLIVLIASAFVICTASAQDYSKVTAAVKSIIPSAENIAVSETPIDGVLQVEVDYQIFYMNASGEYLVQGDIIDLKKRQSLTDAARTKVRSKVLADVNPDDQIRFAPENPAHEVVVFTDVDCGYCRRLHQQIAEYNAQGISVSYMLYPRAGIPSETYQKMVSVWCASDQKTALTQAKQGESIQKRECETPIEAQYELGRKIGLTGTPAIVTANGTLIPGYVEPADLRQRLDAIAALN